MPYKLDFVMPSQNELKNIVKDYKIMDDTKKPEEMDLGDNTSPLKDEIEKFKVWMGDWSGNIIPEFENKIEILLNTENNLKNIGEIYGKSAKKMNSEVYKLKKSESINRRLVEFYSKDYDLKSVLKKYFKYIYFILIGVLVLLLIYKKQHKNKKILAFLLIIIIFPLFFLKRVFDLIIKNIGHFKLDVLYVLLIFITIGVSFGGFKLVQKLLIMITTPENAPILPTPKISLPTKV
tara:strand:- start:448 stop:1152 length:705 start_codon:yes stop_codon:yes gene_type:complete